MRMLISIPYISRDERKHLKKYEYSCRGDNPYCMDLLLDFIHAKFRMLPVESLGWSITFLPPFVALVGTAIWDTSIWVSLYGQEADFDGRDTVPGKFRGWRKFHVQNRGSDIARATQLISQACENYRRDKGFPEWNELVHNAEKEWIRARRREDVREFWKMI